MKVNKDIVGSAFELTPNIIISKIITNAYPAIISKKKEQYW